MSIMFYPKLAASNLKKNGRSYIPYILTCILTISMYYIMKSLSLNSGIQNILGSSTVEYTLSFGSNVVAVFSFIFLFYTNSFLMKGRKKEFGLLNILGLEKKHIAKIIGIESIYVTLISLSLGLLSGIILDKLMYLIITKILDAEISLGFYISSEAIVKTIIIFSVLFLLIFFNSLRVIHLSKPIELLKGGNTGEKEPKAKWLMAITGVICLVIAYYIAVTVVNPVEALTLFFAAVILVIVGTYLVFTAGSITFLKFLKWSKNYYYKTSHFISVSGMIYRMKQNAIGLANICILSTMVLVVLGSTTSLMMGTEEIINERYPYQLEFLQYSVSKDERQDICDIIDGVIAEQDVEVTRKHYYSSLQFSAVFNNNDKFELSDADISQLKNVYNLNFITIDDYNSNLNENLTLDDNEVFVWSNKVKYKHDHIDILGNVYKVKDSINSYLSDGLMTADIVPTYGIVVKDIDVINYLETKQKEFYDVNFSLITTHQNFDTDLDGDKQVALYHKIWDKIEPYINENEISFHSDCRESQRDDIYSLYGSLFFIGIFLSVLFTTAAVLIIYYKQISEGYDDKKRFEIMQKVGMTEQEVKKSIHSQVLMVFFLPLITAGIHTAFSFPILKKILAMFALSDTKLFICCMIGCYLAFSAIYAIVYAMTAKVYYKIVKK